MRNFALALVLSLIPTVLWAQSFPGYFNVTGVASDDTLNVRAEPDGSSEDIGDLEYNAVGIEITGMDASGKWGRMVWQEGDGWVAMRFLEPASLQMIGETPLPAGLVCSGTEPFWSMSVSETSASYYDPSGAGLAFAIAAAQIAQGRPSYPVHLWLVGPVSGNAVIRAGECSDGMSDRSMALEVDLILNVGGQSQFKNGCCQLPYDGGFQ